MPDPGPVIAFPQAAQSRLRLALRSLDAALAEQALACRELRLNLALLGAAVQGLDRRLGTYRQVLEELARDAAAAHAAARAAEQAASRLPTG
ncbi:MAG: hypothetical protein RMK64_11570 [Rhodovarius sp.]|nr:hypothetical protein [Rhodovarius sp.]